MATRRAKSLSQPLRFRGDPDEIVPLGKISCSIKISLVLPELSVCPFSDSWVAFQLLLLRLLRRPAPCPRSSPHSVWFKCYVLWHYQIYYLINCLLTGAQSMASTQAKTRAETTILSPSSMSWKRKTRKLKLLSSEERESLCGCWDAIAWKHWHFKYTTILKS